MLRAGPCAFAARRRHPFPESPHEPWHHHRRARAVRRRRLAARACAGEERTVHRRTQLEDPAHRRAHAVPRRPYHHCAGHAFRNGRRQVLRRSVDLECGRQRPAQTHHRCRERRRAHHQPRRKIRRLHLAARRRQGAAAVCDAARRRRTAAADETRHRRAEPEMVRRRQAPGVRVAGVRRSAAGRSGQAPGRAQGPQDDCDGLGRRPDLGLGPVSR